MIVYDKRVKFSILKTDILDSMIHFLPILILESMGYTGDVNCLYGSSFITKLGYVTQIGAVSIIGVPVRVKLRPVRSVASVMICRKIERPREGFIYCGWLFQLGVESAPENIA